MATFRSSTHVAAAPERVFEVFTDLGKAAQRIESITALEILTPGPVGLGTRWRETRVMFKRESSEEMEITAFDPPRGYSVGAMSCGVLYDTRFDFTPEGDGTRVEWIFKGTPQTFGAKLTAPIFGLFFGGMLKKCMRADLEALRAACEGQESAAGVSDAAAPA
jgi:hypothetical protein